LRQVNSRAENPDYSFRQYRTQLSGFARRRIMKSIIAAGLLLVLGSAFAPAGAAEIQVKMLNKGTEGMMVFEPALMKVAPGDTVKFIATNKGHNAETIASMVPEGAKTFEGKVDEELAITFDKDGIYGVRCKPHYGMGMVAMIVVGSPVNEQQARAVVHPGKAKSTFANLFAKMPSILAANSN
jgi:pseudoazurin